MNKPILMLCAFALWINTIGVMSVCNIDFKACQLGPFKGSLWTYMDSFDSRDTCKWEAAATMQHAKEQSKANRKEAIKNGKTKYTTMSFVVPPKCFPVGHNPNW